MFIVMFFVPIGSTTANDETIKVDLVTTPINLLFDVQNLKPGDVIKRTLTIENHGNTDIHYVTEAAFLSGSKKLYKQLKLWVTDGQQVLYEGSLSGFNGLDKRKLTLTDSDKLHFYVEFPYESGNEFQGLATEFEIVLAAAEKPVGIFNSPDSPNNQLPKTGMLHPVLYVILGIGILAVGAIGLYLRRLKKTIGYFLNL